MPRKWTKSHELRVARILELMRAEARPFPDSSPEASAARKALPFDDWIHLYFPHYAYVESSPLHLLADDACEEKGLPVAFYWFRGAAKTTRALLRRLRRIVTGRARFLIVGGLTQDNAAEKLDMLKIELENNPRLRQDYGADLTPRMGDDTETDWISLRTRVLARGIGQSCRGLLHGPSRPDDFLGDDLEDDVLARNPQRTQHLWDWLFGNVFPALQGAGADAWCELLLNNYGTRFCLKSRFAEAAQQTDAQGKPLCRYIEYLALDDDGNSTWPQRYSRAALDRMAAIMGRALFGREMLGKSYSADDVFRAEWIRAFRAADLDLSTCEVRAALDCSAKAKDTNDFKAIIVLARRIGSRDLFCVHAWIRRASPLELIEHILWVWDTFRPGRFGCEENGFQTLIWPLLEASEALRGRAERIGLFPIVNTASKEDRILQNAPGFEQGLYFFDAAEGDQKRLIDQWLDYGKTGVHDDGPDAWDMARSLFPRVLSGRPKDLYTRGERRTNFAALCGV